jgi:hypothetical protein
MTDTLLSLAGVADAECLAGDLHEEFAIVKAECGSLSAGKWYVWQLARSVARPLTYRTLIVFMTVTPPALGLQWLWKSIFDHLCATPSDGMLQVNVLCLLAGAMLTIRLFRAFAGSLLCAGVAFGLWIGPSAYPHIVAAMLAAPVGVMAAQIVSRAPTRIRKVIIL